MVAVKADGYGHGAVQVARAAVDGGATWLGACSQAEALTLRAAGITVPVLAWLDLPTEDRAPGVAASVDFGASSVDELAALADAADRAGRPARAHLKIDTGMTRNGCAPSDWAGLLARRRRHSCRRGRRRLVTPGVRRRAGSSVGGRAGGRFDVAYQQALDAGFVPLRHLANSAATLTRPDLHFDLVRPGIACYGLNPVAAAADLRPAMTFHSSVVAHEADRRR